MSSRFPSWHAWYGVMLLLGIYINSFLDRTILTLLIGPVRGTMNLSDSQVGFLSAPRSRSSIPSPGFRSGGSRIE